MSKKWDPRDEPEPEGLRGARSLAMQKLTRGRAGDVVWSAAEQAEATQAAEAAGRLLVDRFLEQTRALGLEPNNELFDQHLRRPTKSPLRVAGYTVVARESVGWAWYLGLVAGDYFYLCPDGRRAVKKEVVLDPARPSLFDRLRDHGETTEDVWDGWRFEPVLGCLPEDLAGGRGDPLAEAMDRYLEEHSGPGRR